MKSKRKPKSIVIYVSTRRYKGQSRQFNVNGVKFFIRVAPSSLHDTDSCWGMSKNRFEFLSNSFEVEHLEELQ